MGALRRAPRPNGATPAFTSRYGRSGIGSTCIRLADGRGATAADDVAVQVARDVDPDADVDSPSGETRRFAFTVSEPMCSPAGLNLCMTIVVA